MLINTRTLSYLKYFVIMSAKNLFLAKIFTLQQSKSMHIPQQQLTRKKVHMYVSFLSLEASKQKPENEENRGNSLLQFDEVMSKYQKRSYHLQWKGIHTLKESHVKQRNLNAIKNPPLTLTLNKSFVKRVYIQSHKMNIELIKQGLITHNILLRQNNVIFRTMNFYKKIICLDATRQIFPHFT